MKLRKIDTDVLCVIADAFGIPESEARRAVVSYFDSIVDAFKASHFDDLTRIYMRDAFDERSSVVNIPYIGRIGHVYSKYLKWRSDASASLDTVRRDRRRRVGLAETIEQLAERALAGEKIRGIGRLKVPAGTYKNVWVVSKAGKRAATIVIKNKENV